MRKTIALSVFCLLPLAAAADEITSVYSRFDLKDCEQIEMPDGYLFEGSWRCKGYGGFDILLAGADARNFVGFGKSGGNNCAFSKTFQAFNTALSPIEWRLSSGKPFAAIERWFGNQRWRQVRHLAGRHRAAPDRLVPYPLRVGFPCRCQ